MKDVFRIEGKRLIRVYDSEKLWIEPWGDNSLRVRVTHLSSIQIEDWALLPQEARKVEILID